MKYPLPLALALALFSPLLYADECRYLVDIPQVTAVSGSSQGINDAPASVTILTREIIDASGARTIPELLQLVPGFQSYRVDSHKWGVTYHGMADDLPNRLLFQVDGRSVYLPLLSSVDWSSLGLSLDDIDRIEVVRGSNAATQGSNAFNGSVNIITRSALKEQGFRASTELGNRGARKQTFSASDRFGSTHFRVSAGYQEDDGSQDSNDGFRDRYLNLQLVQPLNLRDTLTFRAGVDQGYIISSTDYTHARGRYSDKREHKSHHLALDYEHIYSATGTLTLSAWEQSVDLETPTATDEQLERFFGPALSGVDLDAFRSANSGLRPVAEHGDSLIRDLSLRVSDKFGPVSVSSSLGWRGLSEKSDLLLYDGKVSEDQWRAQSALEWRVSPHWTLNGGALVEASDENNALSLRQSVNFKPDEQSVIRLGWSRSERLPSILETNQNSSFYLPGRDAYLVDYKQYESLEPELNQTWELGYHRRLGSSDFIDLRLFREKVSNAIYGTVYTLSESERERDSVINNKVTARANGAGWVTSGIETQVKLQLTPDIYSLASYSYARSSEETGLPTYIDTPVPEHTLSLLLNWSLSENMEASVNHRYLSGVEWLQNDRTFTASQHQTNLRLAYRWPQVDSGLETALLIQGLGDSQWHEFSQDNSYHRGVFLQLNLTYP
ncbi:TonB-dependent receptor plug domain-containing protein [Marinobacterium lutimaris]|uniref:Iron complex outermembrane recepter protein n=1 Tax=Marinobacterium lutimaris TaxID=568106 RepID=A0A1H6CTR6_9GAMM|nr:TonB-dependent receptor plug domain-containing protein [Marinobacterium lutimaris]SEG76342.1 iron complex outermembrane recepter protein [Marinobacterium lutimaris]